MRALQLTAWEAPCEFREVPAPEPGPGQVVIRVGGAGACHSDLHLMRDFPTGTLPFAPPFTLGHENAGWIAALGPGTHHLEVGQPVAVYGPWGCGWCHRCRAGAENSCDNQAQLGVYGGGLGLDGGMAPLMLVPHARHLVALRDLHPVDAAPLTDAALTPYHAIKRSIPRLGAGSTAVVIGAGGLGQMAVQILTTLTATTVVAVDRSAEALRLAGDLGAERSVVAGPDAAREILDLTNGRGADLVLDVVGTDETLALAAKIVRTLGDLTLVGLGGGTLPFGFFALPYEVSVATTYWGTLPELMEVVDLAEAGRIRTVVERFDLDDAPRAYDALAAGTLHGRAVITPGSDAA